MDFVLVTCINTLYDCNLVIQSLKYEITVRRYSRRVCERLPIVLANYYSYYSGNEDHGAIHGTMGTFDPTLEDWSSYTERLQQYFTANDVAEDKQEAILLSGCGVATYRLIKNLTAPEKPTDKTFAQLVQLVGEHHNPKPSVIVERFRFNMRTRQQGESVATL